MACPFCFLNQKYIKHVCMFTFVPSYKETREAQINICVQTWTVFPCVMLVYRPGVCFPENLAWLKAGLWLQVTAEDCREIVSVCKSNNIVLAVCHVLRYMPWACKIKEIIQSGEIGEVVNIQHTEPVSARKPSDSLLPHSVVIPTSPCLLYTSDAADES